MFKIKGFWKYGLVILVLPFIFSGCSIGGSKQPTGPTIVTVWRATDDEDVFRETIKQFEAANANVKVNLVKKNPADYELDSLNALASQKGPDVWSIRNDWIARHADKLVPAAEGAFRKDKKDNQGNAEIIKNNFVPIVGEDLIIDNKVYGLTLGIDSLALLYNPDLFQQARKNFEKNNPDTADKSEALTRAPQTWDEFVEAVKMLQAPSAAIGGAYNTNRATDLLSVIMLQNGTEMTTADGQTVAFNLPTSKESGAPVVPGYLALDFYTSFATGSKGYQSWSKTSPDSLKMFIDGQLPIVFGYARDVAYIKQNAPKLNFKIAPLLQVKGATEAVDYGSYWAETVTKSSKNPALAWSFLQYLSANFASEYQQATGLASPKKPDQKIAFDERAESNQPFKAQAPTAKSWNKGKEPGKVDRVFMDMIQNVLNGISVQISLDNGAKQTTDLLRAGN